MASTATLPVKETGLDFFTLFVNKNTEQPSIQRNHTHALSEWMETSRIIVPVETHTLSAGRIVGSDQLYARFRLRQEFQHHFILLRGLLEFSRPKDIAVSADNIDRSFEVRLPEQQLPQVIAYFETIVTRLLNEIRFKASLKMIVKYEERIRLEQRRLYDALKASVR